MGAADYALVSSAMDDDIFQVSGRINGKVVELRKAYCSRDGSVMNYACTAMCKDCALRSAGTFKEMIAHGCRMLLDRSSQANVAWVGSCPDEEEED